MALYMAMDAPKLRFLAGLANHVCNTLGEKFLIFDLWF